MLRALCKKAKITGENFPESERFGTFAEFLRPSSLGCCMRKSFHRGFCLSRTIRKKISSHLTSKRKAFQKWPNRQFPFFLAKKASKWDGWLAHCRRVLQVWPKSHAREKENFIGCKMSLLRIGATAEMRQWTVVTLMATYQLELSLYSQRHMPKYCKSMEYWCFYICDRRRVYDNSQICKAHVVNSEQKS